MKSPNWFPNERMLASCLLTFKNLLCGKCIFLRTKGAKNKVFPSFEEHSLVLDKTYRQLYYNISADIIIYKLP